MLPHGFLLLIRVTVLCSSRVVTFLVAQEPTFLPIKQSIQHIFRAFFRRNSEKVRQKDDQRRQQTGRPALVYVGQLGRVDESREDMRKPNVGITLREALE